MFYEKLQREKQKLETRINVLEKQLKTYPEGKLICVKNGGYNKWYQSDGKTKKYIPKKNQRLAEQLAIKKYLTLLEELNHLNIKNYFLHFLNPSQENFSNGKIPLLHRVKNIRKI